MNQFILRVAALACITVAATRVSAEPTLELAVTPEPGSTTIVLTVTNDAGERPEILGFHVYRELFTGEIQLQTAQAYCSARTRLTDDFLPRQPGTSSYSFRLVDGPLITGRAYRYFVEGSPRFVPPWDWSVGFDVDKSWVTLTTGPTLIAASARVHEIDGEVGLAPCGCFAWVNLVASAPIDIVNTGTVWTIYGTIRPRGDGPGFEVVVDSAEPLDGCLDFAVLPSAWGTVKSLYR